VTDLTLKSQSTNRLLWSLDHMAVTIEELNLLGSGVKGAKGGNAEFHINGVENGSLEFTGGKLLHPKRLEGTITNASAKNLAIDLGD
jgi:hypothetical protein